MAKCKALKGLAVKGLRMHKVKNASKASIQGQH